MPLYVKQHLKHINCSQKRNKMKAIRLVFLLAVSFITLTSMLAQPNKAEFKFDQETHDFGKIPQGTPVSYEFKFTNVGTEPLIISKVESTCGCTVPEFPKTPVNPGATGTIKVTFDAAASAPFSKMVTIRSNSKTPVKALYIKGVVVKK